MAFKKLAYLFASLGSAFGLLSCDKEKEPEETLEVTPSVYIAFTYDSISPENKTIHCSAIWNDGKIMRLSQGRDEDVYVYDVFVAPNGDVYAAGNFGKNPLYWKNGEEHPLSSGRAATGVGVLNGKVYCCGYDVTPTGEQAMMWVDDEAQELKSGVRCNRMFIGNNSCYVAGYGHRVVDGEIAENAVVWVNGKPMSPLMQTSSGVDNTAEACDIVYGDNVVWVVGCEKAAPASYYLKVWIDYTNNNLENPGMNSRINAIAYEKGTYYMAGNDGAKAKYWKANQKSKTERRLAKVESFTLSDKSNQSTVSDIAVLDSKVYCVGYVMSKNSYQAKYWVNAKEESLGLPYSFSNVVPQSIAVVKK